MRTETGGCISVVKISYSVLIITIVPCITSRDSLILPTFRSEAESLVAVLMYADSAGMHHLKIPRRI